MQVVPSPEYPNLQLQEYVPGKFMQIASGLQVLFPLHSLMSIYVD